jgi:putative aminopeptidase FrvX
MELKMNLEEFLYSISSASCISGREGAAEIIFGAVKVFSPDACFDRLGSIVAPVIPPKEGGEHLLIDAHIDEIGFVVTNIDDEGFLRVGKVGGPDLRILLGHEVTVFGSEPLFGLFCCRPPHLSNAEDYKKAPSVDELAIDIGRSKESAAALVSPGDFVTLRCEPARLKNGLITGKALDNRAGVAAVLRTLKLLQGKKLNIGLTAVLSISEELGERGAKAAAFGAAPTQAIVIDTSFAMTPDSPREKCGELFKGPMIGVSPVLSHEITSQLFALASEKGIPYQTEVMSGDTGTNSDAISVTRSGVSTGLLSIPLRYMHTACEVVAIQDIENTAQLAAAYILSIGGEEHV